jgi:hypothetical protein
MAILRPWRNAVLVAAIWLAGWSAITAQASEIKDDAGLFSPAAVKTATESLNELEKRDHLPVQIETYATIPADKLAEFNKLPKSEWHQFYHKWIQERAKATDAKGLSSSPRVPDTLNIRHRRRCMNADSNRAQSRS